MLGGGKNSVVIFSYYRADKVFDISCFVFFSHSVLVLAMLVGGGGRGSVNIGAWVRGIYGHQCEGRLRPLHILRSTKNKTLTRTSRPKHTLASTAHRTRIGSQHSRP